MTCRPSNNKYERCACEPFVKSFSVFYSRNFTFREVPDLKDRQNPKPDARYREEETNSDLVIERKSIVHPKEYARWHNYDHRIMNHLSTYLRPEIAEGPYILNMPFLHKATKDDEIARLAQEICDFIHENFEELLSDGNLEFMTEEPRLAEYALCRKDETRWDECYDGPLNKLIFQLSGTGGRLPRFKWKNIGESDVPRLVEEAIGKASQKSRTYTDARKVLLIERHGDIHGPLDPAFGALVSSACKPELIDEIWDAWIEAPDYDEPVCVVVIRNRFKTPLEIFG